MRCTPDSVFNWNDWNGWNDWNVTHRVLCIVGLRVRALNLVAMFGLICAYAMHRLLLQPLVSNPD